MYKRIPLTLALLLIFVGSVFVACESEITSVNNSSLADDLALKGFEVYSVDTSSHVITIFPHGKANDSLYFEKINIPEGSSAYLSANNDLIDPEIDWDNPIVPGSAIAFDEDKSVVIVVLDEHNRVSEVWKVKVVEKSSSSEKVKSSSSAKESSSSRENNESSSSVKENTSGSTPVSSSEKNVESSAEHVESSAENIRSSSSENPSFNRESSSSENISQRENTSSSSLVVSSESQAKSSSNSILQQSSDKFIERIMFTMNGLNYSDYVIDTEKKVIDLGFVNDNTQNSIQVYSISVSEGAVANITLNVDLTMKKIFEENTLLEINTKYGYEFTITAEDGSIDIWTIITSVSTKNGTLLSDFGVATRDSAIFVKGDSIYVEVPYGTDLMHITLLPMDSVVDLSRGIQMEFINENIKKIYTVKAGMQLPGTEFNDWDKNFWGSSSEAMATEGVSKVCAALFTVKVQSSANLEFQDSKAILTTRQVVASSIGLDGGWKIAGGFYFAGNFTGINALELYDENRTSGCPLENTKVNMSKKMNFGKPFTARPISFDINYSYVHENINNAQYPQKSLIYVMLLSDDSKLVASGAIMDNVSVDNVSKNIELVYGGDPYGLLSGEYPIAEGIEIGTGNESVASIHVMFASSAYAHVVAGGVLGNSDEYRGGENSKLILDSFKLNY